MPFPESRKRRYERPVSLAEALQLSPTLKRLGVRDEEQHMDIARRWNEVVGEAVARNSQPLKFSRGVLQVAVSTPAWLHNLTLMKPQVMENLRRAFGAAAVSDVRFRTADFDLKAMKRGA